MFIRSERLFLRPVWSEDWADIWPLIADEAVVRNLARVPWPYGADDARCFATRPQDPRFPHFLVTRPDAETGVETLGCIALLAGEHADGCMGAELGFWIAPAYWGQGYASEAARALLGLAPVLGHRRLIAAHFRDNQASGRVLRKLGFWPTGEVVQRTSPARGAPAPAALLAIDLEQDGGGDCDDRARARPVETLRAA